MADGAGVAAPVNVVPRSQAAKGPPSTEVKMSKPAMPEPLVPSAPDQLTGNVGAGATGVSGLTRLVGGVASISQVTEAVPGPAWPSESRTPEASTVRMYDPSASVKGARPSTRKAVSGSLWKVRGTVIRTTAPSARQRQVARAEGRRVNRRHGHHIHFVDARGPGVGGDLLDPIDEGNRWDRGTLDSSSTIVPVARPSPDRRVLRVREVDEECLVRLGDPIAVDLHLDDLGRLAGREGQRALGGLEIFPRRRRARGRGIMHRDLPRNRRGQVSLEAGFDRQAVAFGHAQVVDRDGGEVVINDRRFGGQVIRERDAQVREGWG